MTIKTFAQVVSWQLCVGCGACVYMCKNKNIELRDVPDQGLRPTPLSDQCGTCMDYVQVCPGYSTPDVFINRASHTFQNLNEKSWGSIIEIWEGYANDSEVRYNGSSGGAATAIALYCLENNCMRGVLHIGSDEKNPLRNEVFLSRNRLDLISSSVAGHFPASP